VSVHAATVERSGSGARRRSLELTGTWLLSGAMAGAGLLAYAFHILAARTLTTSEYGQVAAFWAALFIVVVVLFRPLEQTTARSIADRLARGEEGASVLRPVLLVYVCLLGVVVAGATLGWNVLTRELFDGSSFMTAMLVVGIAGYGVQYLARGVLGGLRRFRALSGIHLGDGIVRLALALVLVAVASKDVAAAALAAAGIGGAIVPLWRCRGDIAGLRRGESCERFHLGSALRFAWPAAVIAGSDQILVNAAPLLVIAGGGPGAKQAAAVVFAATMLVRVPVFVFSGVAGSLLPNLARLNATADHQRFTTTVRRVCGIFAAATVGMTVLAGLAGPTVMKLLYGPDYLMSGRDLALLGFGAGCYLACGTISQALLALARATTAAVAWSFSAALFVIVETVSSGSDLHRVSLGIAAGMATNVLLLALTFAQRVRTAAPVVATG
jgi:O-antigen/teichoic acid export membrane protein